MKKSLSLILSLCIMISAIGFILANGSDTETSNVPLAPPSDWALESVERAETLGITENGKVYRYTMSITREDFCELIYNYVDIATNLKNIPSDNPFSDTENPHIYTLHFLGIINGKSETQFAPNDLLTREEAATILFRLIDKVHPDWAANQLYYEFEDSVHISDWSMNSIQTICNMGIMQGVGNGKFAPKDHFSTEQAITTLIRVYDSFNITASDTNMESLSFADKVNACMPNDTNYMFSPLSIKTALMMAANGASGVTQEEILKALDIDDLNAYNESTRKMLDKYSESDILKLCISNSIWINSDKTSQKFSEDYKNTLSQVFDASIDTVTDKDAVSKINGWVNEKTQGKIPTIISEENNDFWAMLINAVYFKGRWQNEFSKNATKKDIFTSKDGSTSEIDFMNKTAWINYTVTDGVTIVSLPYLTRQDIFDENGEHIETKKLDGVNISMYLMMSDKDFSPEEVLKNSEKGTEYISLSVPKFNIEYNTSLNSVLKAIGINKAFEENAEFEKMFDDGNMFLDKTLHKTYIKVDEEGTEAAAVTALSMAGSSLPPKPIEVKFNRPFTFVIKDIANGEILFMGEYSFAK